jgi:hypothetical protein
MRANGATASAFEELTATAIALSLSCPAGTALAGAFGRHTIEIQGYTSTTFLKAVVCTAGGAGSVATNNTSPNVTFGWWNSAAAINRIQINALTTPFTWVTGSVLRIYGRL